MTNKNRNRWVEDAWVQQTKDHPASYTAHPDLDRWLQGITRRLELALQDFQLVIDGTPRDDEKDEPENRGPSSQRATHLADHRRASPWTTEVEGLDREITIQLTLAQETRHQDGPAPQPSFEGDIWEGLTGAETAELERLRHYGALPRDRDGTDPPEGEVSVFVPGMVLIGQRKFWLQLKELAGGRARSATQQQTNLTRVGALYQLIEQQYRRSAWVGEGPEVERRNGSLRRG